MASKAEKSDQALMSSNGKSTAGTSPTEKKVMLVPPDGGWGWVIIFASVINLMVIPTTVTCFGVIIPFILREFDANIGAVSWIPGLAVAVLNLLGPWTAAMLGLYSHRRLGVIGSGIVSIALIASSFAPSVNVLFITYGLLLGFGCALSSTMGMLITQEYFAVRRPMANGLMMAGGSLGQMLIPLVIQGLFDEFGLRGGLLVYSTVVLQSLVASALFQPSRWHWKLAVKNPPVIEASKVVEPSTDVSEDEKQTFASPPQSPTRAIPKYVLDDFNGNGRSRSNSWTGHSRVKISTGEHHDIHHDIEKKKLNRAHSTSAKDLSPNSGAAGEGVGTSSLISLGVVRGIGSLASLAPINAKVMQTPVEMSVEEMRQQLKTRSQQDKRSKWIRWMPRCPPASKILNVQLIKNPYFIIMSVVMALGRLTYQQFNVLVPSFAQSIGIDPTSAASLVTILAAADTVARLFVPILADKLSRFISTLNVCLIEFVICAVGSFALALSTDFTGMVISCVIYGIGIGGITGLTVVVIVQTLGMQQLTSAFGLNVFIGGLVVFPGIIIIGYIQVLTQSFPICFHVVGGVCIICCFMWAPLPLILRRQNARIAKAEGGK